MGVYHDGVKGGRKSITEMEKFQIQKKSGLFGNIKFCITYTLTVRRSGARLIGEAEK